jgi:hypothetical protein
MTERFGSHVLGPRIAHGGMAEIYAAVHEDGEGDVRVCIKRILPGYDSDPDFERMFLQEARIAGSIDHPNVVRVLDSDRQDGRLYMVMEYVDGLDLRKILSAVEQMGAHIPLGFSFRVIRYVLEALHGVSQTVVEGKIRPIVHRDISPHNIMISRTGEVKLTDFGIAKARGASTVTQMGCLKGKMAYLAPEQTCSGEVTPATDIFAVGLVLYELLTGKRFNPGVSESEIMVCAMNPVFSRIEWLSLEINSFLSRLLHKDPTARFSGANEALAAFHRLALPGCSAEEASRFFAGLALPPEHAAIFSEVDSFCLQAGDRTAVTERRSSSDIGMHGDARGRIAEMGWGRRAMGIAMIIAAVGIGGLFLGYHPDRKWSGEISPESQERIPVDGASVTASERGNAGVEPVPLLVPIVDEPLTEINDSSEPTPMPERRNGPVLDTGLSSVDREVVPSGEDVRSEVPDEVSAYGLLQVNCRPWAHVRINGKDAGTTPIRERTLRAGKHRIELINEIYGYHRKMDVRVTAGELTRIREFIPMDE